MFQKRCARCHQKFMRLGCAPGQAGYLGRILGGLAMFLFFGGTSKYCPSCREALIQEKENGQQSDPRHKLDKTFLFRLVWFLVAAGIVWLWLQTTGA